jgi:hypothetical protein
MLLVLCTDMLNSAEDDLFLGSGKKSVPSMLMSISEEVKHEGAYAFSAYLVKKACLPLSVTPLLCDSNSTVTLAKDPIASTSAHRCWKP